MNAAATRAWESGLIASWYLRPRQLEVYLHLFEHKNPFVEKARRFGGTTTVLAYVLEKLRQAPGRVARWCCPWKNQAREIVLPELITIQKDCPESLRFHFQTTDSVCTGPNGSKLFLRGINEDRGESARGSFADIIVADEFGSWRDPIYTCNEVLRPQLLTTRGQFIFVSSPSRDLGHQYYLEKEHALRENRFIQRTIYDNEGLTNEEIEEEAKNCGGKETAAWLREYLCQPIADIKSLVIPEFKDELHVVPDDYKTPEWFDTYVGVDFGFNDCTAFVFGYVEFNTGTLIIEDELVLSGANTRDIAQAALAIERRLWPAYSSFGQDRAVFRRVGDNELQQIFDMSTIHGYYVMPTRKDDKQAAVQQLRLRFQAGKIKIKSRCKNLLFQLKVGMWNDTKTNFVRGERIGHLDAIDALIYLNRNLDLSHNPYPGPGYYVQGKSHVINPETSIPQGSNEDILLRSFRPFG